MILKEILYDTKIRETMTHDNAFKNFLSLWINNNFYDDSNIGNINYIIKEFYHYYNQKNSPYYQDKKFWVLYYFESGKKRQIIIANHTSEISNCNQFYGRTFQEIYELSLKYKEILIKNMYNVTDDYAFNLVYIFLFDLSFQHYEKILKYLNYLNKNHTHINTKYNLSTPMDTIKYAIDIVEESLIYEDIKLSAYKVLDNKNLKLTDALKHEVFQKISDIQVNII